MQIKLFYDFKKRLNSTKRPIIGDAEIRNVTLKVPTSVDSPSFILTTNKQLLDYDVRNIYVYVPVWSRYYFVRNIVFGNNDLYELQCETDILATYKDDIAQYECFVERSNNANLMFNDPNVSPTQKVVSRDSKFTSLSITFNNGCYGIRVAGGGTTGVTTYIFQDLATVANIFDKTKYDLGSGAEAWTNMIGNYIFDPYDYVLDLFYIPIRYETLAANTYTEDKPFNIKWYTVGGNSKALKQGAVFTFGANNISLPDNVYSDFRKYNPSFSQYFLTLAGFGTFPIDGNLLEGLDVNYATDLQTGDTRIWLENIEDGTVYADYKTNIYTKIQFGNADIDLTSLTGSAASLIGTMMSGNVIGSAVTSVQTVSNIFNPPPSVGGANGGIGLMYDSSIVVSVINYGTSDRPSGVCGFTTFKNLRLGTLSGYVKCGNASLPIIGLTGDREKVNGFLNGGFYYE